MHYHVIHSEPCLGDPPIGKITSAVKTRAQWHSSLRPLAEDCRPEAGLNSVTAAFEDLLFSGDEWWILVTPD